MKNNPTFIDLKSTPSISSEKMDNSNLQQSITAQKLVVPVDDREVVEFDLDDLFTEMIIW